MITEFNALATQKIPRGGQQRLCESQVIQSQLAQAEARLRSARAFLLTSFREIWEAGDDDNELTPEQNALIRLGNNLGDPPGSRGGQHALPRRRCYRDLLRRLHR